MEKSNCFVRLSPSATDGTFTSQLSEENTRMFTKFVIFYRLTTITTIADKAERLLARLPLKSEAHGLAARLHLWNNI